MLYLSQLLYKPLYLKEEVYAKIIDFGIPDMLQTAQVQTLLIKKSGKKYAISFDDVSFENHTFILQKEDITLLPYDPDDFYLAEDLLDKQVIDVTGKRLVRVNDVLLKENGKLVITGIDIGFAGIIRRLGLSSFIKFKTITIPWKLIEAFDYETGAVRVKLSQQTINTLHPTEIAHLLEDAGTKERMGLVHALDPQTAAAALEEADVETQQSILENLSKTQLKNIIQKMPISEIADVLENLNSQTIKDIFSHIGKEKTQLLRKLSQFTSNVAGGMMDETFFREQEDITVGEALAHLIMEKEKPESIIVTDAANELVGVVDIKNLVNAAPATTMKDIMSPPHAVFAEASFEEVLEYFAEYNLRVLPVIDQHKKVMGVIPIDNVMAEVYEDEERNDPI